MRWARHVTRKGEIKNAYKILFRNLIGRDHLEDLGVGKLKVNFPCD
jgi:hypothetical protein